LYSAQVLTNAQRGPRDSYGQEATKNSGKKETEKKRVNFYRSEKKTIRIQPAQAPGKNSEGVGLEGIRENN